MTNDRKTDNGDTMGLSGLDDPRAVQTRKDFLEFGPDDAERLRRLAPKVAPQADRIIDAMYEHLSRFEEPAAHLSDEATVRRLKGIQKAYFSELLAGRYDQDYVEGRIKIGLTHVHEDVNTQWYVGAYNLYLRLVTQTLFEEFRAGGRWNVSRRGKSCFRRFTRSRRSSSLTWNWRSTRTWRTSWRSNWRNSEHSRTNAMISNA